MSSPTPPGPGPAPTSVPTTPPPASTPGSEDLPEDLPLPAATGTPVQATGTVTQGVEHGCLLLEDGGTTYLLLGFPDQLPVGAEVTVEGTLAEDVMTTCQQGTPLLVRTVTAR
ncbi:hypothetical protein [Cellulomonas aerilata]|uniref:Uncharacterized protein n=1 Tax=Cellulomonas aerilata TaxID=515326 RepID=A0A512DD64_9CELL|nr:hypothetical protein [Cellulomonas aerilata]GEO34411.1 hypothetical protein CAE01nite_21360 [Cellulomonas aerilata]